MSITSIINNRVDEKRNAVRSKYHEQLNKAREDMAKRLEKISAPFVKEFNALVEKAQRSGIKLDISWHYDDEGFTVKKYFTDDKNGQSQDREFSEASDKIDESECAELKKLDRFRDQAEIVAMLPAKERREEIVKILKELDEIKV